MTHRGDEEVCVCTPWRVYPTHTRSVEGGRGLLDLSHADKNCIMGLIGLLGPGLNFRYFSRVPGQTSRERERSTSATTTSQPRPIYLDGSTPVFHPPSLPPFVPPFRLLFHGREIHWSRGTRTSGGTALWRGGRGIHRSGNFRNKRKEQRRLSLSPLPFPPRPRLLFVTCRVSSIRWSFFFSRLPLASNFFFF